MVFTTKMVVKTTMVICEIISNATLVQKLTQNGKKNFLNVGMRPRPMVYLRKGGSYSNLF